MKKEFQLSEDQLQILVSELTRIYEQEDRFVFLLNGDLGAGKTSLVKEFCKALDPNVAVDSPTFSIVNVYSCSDLKVYHMDLYRLESVEEIEDIGFWEYLDKKTPVFIEWPAKIADLLPEEDCVNVEITVNSQGWRDYSVFYSS
ncbi:tRNA (adenosine(37)-N6)-threonylcarbamoyltransferase complex ATPase subunit type 1 TsaE [bacterium]|nr:tRNA (adenosine(37)-N6)-threonylcarbamoyltransferase complex ATPase subunit type 1 TsaE [bacterium]